MNAYVESCANFGKRRPLIDLERCTSICINFLIIYGVVNGKIAKCHLNHLSRSLEKMAAWCHSALIFRKARRKHGTVRQHLRATDKCQEMKSIVRSFRMASSFLRPKRILYFPANCWVHQNVTNNAKIQLKPFCRFKWPVPLTKRNSKRL